MSQVPGFRSGKWWKQIVAVVGYFLIGLFSLTGILGKQVNWVLFGLDSLAIVLLASNGFRLRSRVPVFNSANKLYEVGGWVALVGVGLIALFTIPSYNTGPSNSGQTAQFSTPVIQAPGAEVKPVASLALMPTPTASPTASPTAPPTSVPPTPTPTAAPTATPTPAPQQVGPLRDKNATNTFTLEVTLKRVDLALETKTRPKAGNIFVLVQLGFTNMGPAAATSTVSPYVFFVKDVNGQLVEPDTWATPSDCELWSINLLPGGAAEGCLAFEVSTSGPLELVLAPYKQNQFEPGRYISWPLR